MRSGTQETRPGDGQTGPVSGRAPTGSTYTYLVWTQRNFTRGEDERFKGESGVVDRVYEGGVSRERTEEPDPVPVTDTWGRGVGTKGDSVGTTTTRSDMKVVNPRAYLVPILTKKIPGSWLCPDSCSTVISERFIYLIVRRGLSSISREFWVEFTGKGLREWRGRVEGSGRSNH